MCVLFLIENRRREFLFKVCYVVDESKLAKSSEEDEDEDSLDLLIKRNAKLNGGVFFFEYSNTPDVTCQIAKIIL